MARSDVTTWLPLDDWATIMGANPLFFNGMFSNTLFPNNDCSGPWFQGSFQHSDRVGRDDLAQAIHEAEQEIAREVGYNLIPDWTLDERLPYPRAGQPAPWMGTGLNPNGYLKSVEALRGHLISGGIRAKELIQAGTAVVRTDLDGDGYAETATAVVPVTITNTNEIHLYYSGKSGADSWEIRPIKVAINGGFATITFKSWQIPAWGALEALNVQPLDADLAGSYESTVDCYRVYNNPATQVQFMWENGGTCGSCCACQFGTQDGCFHLRDPRIGFVVPAPGTWDASTQSFTGLEWSACREPDQVRLWYYSGFRDEQLARPYVEMSPYWKTAVAYYAASKLDRGVCGCNNFEQYVERWRLDMMFSSLNDGGFNVTPEFAANRLGTSVGAFYAFRRIHQDGVRVLK